MTIIIFRSSVRADADMARLETAGMEMYALASAMPGFVSYKDFSAEDGEILPLIEFASEETLKAWRDHPDHVAIQAGPERMHLKAMR